MLAERVCNTSPYLLRAHGEYAAAVEALGPCTLPAHSPGGGVRGNKGDAMLGTGLLCSCLLYDVLISACEPTEVVQDGELVLATAVLCARWEKDGEVHVTAQGAAGVLEPDRKADAAAQTRKIPLRRSAQWTWFVPA